jgi:peptide deformylase
MVLKIAQLGQPILRQPAAPIPPQEIGSPEVQRLIDDMLQTLREANGAGLAGPQVFANWRVFLAAVLPPETPDGPPEVEVFINPHLSATSGGMALAWEGCLSFAELLVKVARYRRVRIEYQDRHGAPRILDLEGFPARVVQHEYDHLEGVLTLDRALSSRHIVKASEIDAVLEQEKDPSASQTQSSSQ